VPEVAPFGYRTRRLPEDDQLSARSGSLGDETRRPLERSFAVEGDRGGLHDGCAVIDMFGLHPVAVIEPAAVGRRWHAPASASIRG